MPFPNQTPIPYTLRGVESLKSGERGCYGLFAGTRCIYVGRGEIRARVLGHLEGDNPCITRYAPTHLFGLITSAADVSEMYREEQRLIDELAPLCNDVA